MNWRLFLGSTIHRLMQSVLSSRALPQTRAFPYNVSCFYDLQRFFGKRDLNVIFDAGANEGQTALDLVDYFPNSRIHCFEPVSGTFKILTKNVSKFSNIKLHNIGLGQRADTMSMRLHESSGLNTLVEDQQRMGDLTGETESITLNTIDNVCSSNQIEIVDLLKMDVQGWEMAVLDGASKLLSEGKIRAVLSEVAFRRDDKDMQFFSDLNDRMVAEGFWLSGFYEVFRYGNNKAILGFCNVLYVHESVINRK